MILNILITVILSLAAYIVALKITHLNKDEIKDNALTVKYTHIFLTGLVIFFLLLHEITIFILVASLAAAVLALTKRSLYASIILLVASAAVTGQETTIANLNLAVSIVTLFLVQGIKDYTASYTSKNNSPKKFPTKDL